MQVNANALANLKVLKTIFEEYAARTSSHYGARIHQTLGDSVTALEAADMKRLGLVQTIEHLRVLSQFMGSDFAKEQCPNVEIATHGQKLARIVKELKPVGA